MMPRAWSRAAAMILSTSTFAVASELWPFSAAARPFAISVWRCSIAFMMTGQMYFMQNQTNTIIAIVWPINVPRLRFTGALLEFYPTGAEAPAADLAARGLQLADERIGEREEQRDTDADHRDGVEQRDHEEHLRTQHRSQLGLPCGALEEPAAEEAHADADAEGAEADQKRNRDRRQTNHDIHLCLQS